MNEFLARCCWLGDSMLARTSWIKVFARCMTRWSARCTTQCSAKCSAEMARSSGADKSMGPSVHSLIPRYRKLKGDETWWSWSIYKWQSQPEAPTGNWVCSAAAIRSRSKRNPTNEKIQMEDEARREWVSGGDPRVEVLGRMGKVDAVEVYKVCYPCYSLTLHRYDMAAQYTQ